MKNENLIKVFGQKLLLKNLKETKILFNILLIFITAIVGVSYARYEGFNTIRSGINQLIKNELPIYEIVKINLVSPYGCP